MDFCKQFNAKTESQAGYIIPVIIPKLVNKVTDSERDFLYTTLLYGR